jgi:hypothetical protein
VDDMTQAAKRVVAAVAAAPAAESAR